MKRTIEIEIVKAGQSMPYNDTVYEAYLTYSSDGMWASHPSRETVKEEARVLVHDFEGEEYSQLPYLKTLEEIEHNKWHVVIVQPYTD